MELKESLGTCFLVCRCGSMLVFQKRKIIKETNLKRNRSINLLLPVLLSAISLLSSCATVDLKAVAANPGIDAYASNGANVPANERATILFPFTVVPFSGSDPHWNVPSITIDGSDISIPFGEPKMFIGKPPRSVDDDGIYKIALPAGEHEIKVKAFIVEENSYSKTLWRTRNSFVFTFEAEKVYSFTFVNKKKNSLLGPPVFTIGFFSFIIPDGETYKQFIDDYEHITGSKIPNKNAIGVWIHEFSPDGTIKSFLLEN